METTGKKLRALRQAKGLTQAQVAQHLADQGHTTHYSYLSRWEQDKGEPSVQQFLSLCALYDVDDVLGTFWQQARGPKINEQGRALVDAVLQAVEKSGLYAPERKTRPIRLYEVPASAGTGEFLDDGQYRMVDVGDEVPQDATFGLPITGDSMEPRYISGQTAWVKKQETLENGEFGVFSLNGNSYIKKLEDLNGRVRLISLNNEYAPIKVMEADNLKVFGKVVAATWLD
ncbi:XRE family transcriptional regulator [Ruminococcaceae bacterium OttesenSCG-928-D13]|nr:XRE family transcriptional regulator [Ruminococcaceae bacterium OttesenSCG-928-D13]